MAVVVAGEGGLVVTALVLTGGNGGSTTSATSKAGPGALAGGSAPDIVISSPGETGRIAGSSIGSKHLFSAIMKRKNISMKQNLINNTNLV